MKAFNQAECTKQALILSSSAPPQQREKLAVTRKPQSREPSKALGSNSERAE
jgi:hypothetical protein